MQEKLGGFSIEDMPAGTLISVETKNSIYQIEILTETKVLVTGGILKDGNVRFSNPTEVILTGCTWGTSFLKKNWLGEGMQMELFYNGSSITTSPIKNVIINHINGKQINLLWGQKD